MDVILIHGMFCGTQCWSLVDKLLHGQGIKAQKVSLHPDGLAKQGRGFDVVTASVQAQIQHWSNQRFVLVGHSLAALVVEKLLAGFPFAIPILVNPSPGWGFFGPLYPLWVAAQRGLFWKGVVDINNIECRKLLFQGMSDKEFTSAIQVIEPESGELVRQAFWFFDVLGASTRISRISTRDMFVLTGALDPMGSPKHSRRLASRYGRGSSVEVVEKVGHMSILQQAGAQKLVEKITAALDNQHNAVVHATKLAG